MITLETHKLCLCYAEVELQHSKDLMPLEVNNDPDYALSWLNTLSC